MSAAISTAAELDLPADHAIVIQNSNKVTLRLLPCDVLARVACAGHEVLEREVDLARTARSDREPRGRSRASTWSRASTSVTASQ